MESTPENIKPLKEGAAAKNGGKDEMNKDIGCDKRLITFALRGPLNLSIRSGLFLFGLSWAVELTDLGSKTHSEINVVVSGSVCVCVGRSNDHLNHNGILQSKNPVRNDGFAGCIRREMGISEKKK